jgi:hypothetical protein
MTERSYQDAVQVLRDRIGGRWEGMEGNGRDEMVRVLHDELGYDNRAANDAIDAMIRSGQIRYHRYGADAAPGDDVAQVPPVPLGVNTQPGMGTGGLVGTPVPAAALGPGYWEIGPGDEGGFAGRAGQIDPTSGAS